MSRSDDQRLADLLDAADELAGVVARGRDSFDADPILRRAYARRRRRVTATSWRPALVAG